MKTPDPKIVAEIKGLSKDAKDEVIHMFFNGFCSVRLQLELDLDKGASKKVTLEHIDKTGDWFRGEWKQLGFIDE